MIESNSIKKAVQTLYSSYLPKGTYPFAYLNIQCDPRNVDVNIHPTKAEVKLLNEDALIEFILSHLQSNVLKNVESRVFTVSSNTMPFMPSNSNSIQISQIRNRIDIKQNSLINSLKPIKVYNNANKLSSIEELILDIESQENVDLSNIIAESKYVGCIEDSNLIIIQHNTSLFLVHFDKFSQEFFYQLSVRNFARFDICSISPLNVASLIRFVNKDCLFNLTSTILDLLSDYFSIRIIRNEQEDTLELVGLPLILQGCSPNLSKLPLFIYKLCNEGKSYRIYKHIYNFK